MIEGPRRAPPARDPAQPLKGARVVVGVAGGIAAYKAAALVRLFEDTARAEKMALQRSAQVGVLTDLSYVQLVGEGVASLDIGFPMRYSHSSVECCDLEDLESLARLTLAALSRIAPGFALNRAE